MSLPREVRLDSQLEEIVINPILGGDAQLVARVETSSLGISLVSP